MVGACITEKGENMFARGKYYVENFAAKMECIIRDRQNLIEVANRCDKAYAEGVGHPEWYTPFGEEQPEKVAQNYAGAQAVMSGVGAICHLRRGKLDKIGLKILWQIINNKLKPEEHDLLLRFSNATWGAGQPFRGGNLSRADHVNMFDLLPYEEVLKDYYQVRAAAEFFFRKMQELK